MLCLIILKLWIFRMLKVQMSRVSVSIWSRKKIFRTTRNVYCTYWYLMGKERVTLSSYMLYNCFLSKSFPLKFKKKLEISVILSPCYAFTKNLIIIYLSKILLMWLIILIHYTYLPPLIIFLCFHVQLLKMMKMHQKI